MRLSLGAIVSLCLAATASAIPNTRLQDAQPKDTIFNGQTVPPMTELNVTTIESVLAKGNWFVEAFSPYCHHCQALAPTLQTMYEYYYTSDPVVAAPSTNTKTSLNSFTKYYDFKFAKLDCVSFGTSCTNMNVTSFPTMMIIRDGKEVARLRGDRSMDELSEFIEEALEIIKPGSRPKMGLQLPEVGATGIEKYKEIENIQGTLKIPVKSKPLPNQKGLSVKLDADAFQKYVTKTLDPWFIKFYVPWCQHCKAVAPVWAAMAREMKDQLNIGEVNCEVEKRLCKDVHVRAYPTILFFKGAERVEYEGLRGMGDFVDYAEKAVAMSEGVRNVNAREFEELEQTEEVIFVYFYDHATVSEDFEALERLPMHLIGHAKLVKTNDTELVKRFKISTWPRLLVSRDGKRTIFEGLSPADLRDVPKISGWMQSVWQPLVPELTASNAHEIMHGKYVVLGLLNRGRPDEFAVAKREIKNAAIEWMEKREQAFQLERQELRDAKQLRIEEAEDRNDQRALRNAKLIKINMDEIERREVGFAWVDVVFWERWIRSTYGISVQDGERVIINDEDNHRYWDQTITGNPIVPSRTSILETLHKVTGAQQLLKPKHTGSSISHFFFQIRSACGSHPWIAAFATLGGIFAFLAWSRARRRSRGGFVKLDEKQGLLGLSSASPNGKVD